MPHELKVPSVGESITEVILGEWLKQEGDSAQKDERLVDIESDKATVEVSAPVSGKITKLLKKKGETAAVGEVIALMEEGPVAAKSAAPAAPAPAAAVPGNGASSALGAIRTVNASPFTNGKAEGIGGDTYFAVIEFSTPVHAEALLSYGNWSKKGSPHVEDQMKLLSRKEMRPIWRDRKDVEAHLEARKVF